MAFTTPRDWTGGEFVTEAMMDTHIRDNFLAMGPHLMVRKTADETVTSSTTLQDDDSLLMAVAANEVWLQEWIIRYSGAITGDIKTAFTFPTGGTLSRLSWGVDTSLIGTVGSTSDTTSPTSVAQFGCNGASSLQVIRLTVLYSNGGSAGNVTLQWAQNTSDGTGTVVRANSTLWAVKLA